MSTPVLLVDDDVSLSETLSLGLRKRGHDVTTQASAEEAQSLVLSEDFDVVVTDVNMAHVSGIELCERIVANRPDLPVIVLTAFGSLDTAVSAIRAGAYDFISKPLDRDRCRSRCEASPARRGGQAPAP